MIYPTVSELLACVDNALVDVSDDATPRSTVKSTLATCRHLIRHAELRFRLEKSILLDDIAKAGDLLRSVADHLQNSGSDPDAIANVIRSVLAEKPALNTADADEIDRIRERAMALRELVYSSLKHLQSAAAAERTTPAYQEIRGRIRDYIKYQIEQESRMVTPAFQGHGPRR